MVHLYVTTNSSEAEALIEDTNMCKKAEYRYQDIKSRQGETLTKTLGFNPMCSVELGREFSAKLLREIVTKLLEEGLFVAVEYYGTLKSYIPTDIEFRDELVKIGLHKEMNKRFGKDPCCAVLTYSNNPNRIRTFYNQYY